MSVLIVIQARLKATRLPGKVLEKIGDLTVLEHVYQRCEMAGPTVVAMPLGDRTALQVPDVSVVWMGPDENDVLNRVLGAAMCATVEPDVVVRVTADCPFIRPEDIRSVVGGLVLSDADYAWNVGDPRQCPDGYDVEAFTWEALRHAHRIATDPADREHVTPWMRRNLRCAYVPTHTNMGHYRWTLDTSEDLAWMRSVAERCDVTPGAGPTQEQLVAYRHVQQAERIHQIQEMVDEMAEQEKRNLEIRARLRWATP